MNEKIQTFRQLAPQPLNVYELVLPGFDGSTDETDDRVLWIEAKDQSTVVTITGGLPLTLVGRGWIDASAIDYTLPRDADGFNAAMQAFDAAAIAPALLTANEGETRRRVAIEMLDELEPNA